MCLLVRKIDRAKWVQNDIVSGAAVSADAITNCLRTTGNKLSTWRVTDASAIEEAVLAMSSQFDHLDALDVVAVEESALAAAGLNILATPGRTAIGSFADRHRDIAGLTYTSLGALATFIVGEFQADRVHRFTKGQLRRLLVDAISDGVLRADDLKPSVKSEVARSQYTS